MSDLLLAVVLIITCPIWAGIILGSWILGVGTLFWICGVPVKITINGTETHYRWFKRIS